MATIADVGPSWLEAPGRASGPGASARLRPSPAVLRRRRSVFAGAVAVTVVTCLGLSGALGSGSPDRSWRPATVSSSSLRSAPVGVKLYVVKPGDTLWGIATDLAGNGDPRPIMQRLAEQAAGGVLVVGQRLVLP